MGIGAGEWIGNLAFATWGRCVVGGNAFAYRLIFNRRSNSVVGSPDASSNDRNDFLTRQGLCRVLGL